MSALNHVGIDVDRGRNRRRVLGVGGTSLESRSHARITHLTERTVALTTAEEVRDEEVAVAVRCPQATVGVAVTDVPGSCR